MNPLEPVFAICPYCGETLELWVDCGISTQTYIEDCPVCCRPITCHTDCTGAAPILGVQREDEC